MKFKKLGRAFFVLAFASVATWASASPASAHSLGSAVVSEEGCDWANGNYTVLYSDLIEVDLIGGPYEQLGTAYLLWNAQYGENCAVTMRTGGAHGTSTWTTATLYVQTSSGSTRYEDEGFYGHYAAVSGPAQDQCVRYEATIDSPETGYVGWGGRPGWDNCD
ncbi:hypothetical protein KIK06_16125 [Nocardiopsis sp. EMB25]|uniref:hypothetical protein n=1 Tax=Nocardiopsis sp. EMB25 TaxID=2835867 RepID=UPI002284AA80|nr:hypothetical protein [Nocardiopsis sp. EMB25]MCY9785413.1 hypothetical protein [Nocardiopsis sp. EMB25]